MEGHVSIENTSAFIANRCFVWSNTGGSTMRNHAIATPDLGGDIDGVKIGGYAIMAVPGFMEVVEASAAFAAGTILATIADGRVRTKGAGELGVMRALEASSGAGYRILAVFTSGR